MHAADGGHDVLACEKDLRLDQNQAGWGSQSIQLSQKLRHLISRGRMELRLFGRPKTGQFGRPENRSVWQAKIGSNKEAKRGSFTDYMGQLKVQKCSSLSLADL